MNTKTHKSSTAKDRDLITISADQLMALAEAIVPIRCLSVDCLYSKPNNSCFLNPVELEKGICRYYRPTAGKSIDREDLPGSFVKFVNDLRRKSDKG